MEQNGPFCTIITSERDQTLYRIKSPLKLQTIPRLELLSELLLARLISNVVKSLSPRFEVQHIRCFTDSQVALCWIRGVDRDRKAFVQSRVEEIRRLVSPKLWNHCPGSGYSLERS